MSEPRFSNSRWRHLLAAAWASGAATAAWPQGVAPAPRVRLQDVEVIATTPLPGSGVALSKLPANAQVFTGGDLRQQRAGNLTEFLEQNATSITVNAAQGNPYQPDINFRGFTASPLLGTPQAISVFFDGVRINEPFGDAVNWDLIPQSAIASIQLIPGSNPAFGLNTLGGAIALYSKRGATEYPDAPGGAITLSDGSFGCRTLLVETGGRRDAWDWFVTANDARDQGWAEHNASRVRQGSPRPAGRTSTATSNSASAAPTTAWPQPRRCRSASPTVARPTPSPTRTSTAPRSSRSKPATRSRTPCCSAPMPMGATTRTAA